MEMDSDCKTSRDATSLLHSLCTFEMVLCLVVLSTYLQGTNVDIVTVQKTAESVLKTLKKIRNSADFAALWEKACGMVENIQTALTDNPYYIAKPTVPRARRLPRRFDGDSGEETTYNSPDIYYRVVMYYASLDLERGKIENRFKVNDYDLLCSLSSVVCDPTKTKEAAEKVSQYYGLDEAILKAESQIFSESRTEDCGNSAVEIVKWITDNKLDDVSPTFNIEATILSVIPATSCSAERSFSTLRRLKTYMRASMRQQRMTSLTICNIE